MPNPMNRRAVMAGLCLALAAGSACSSPPGRRMLQDSFVVFTSPAQIPVMAFRDAAEFNDSAAATIALFPINFPIYLLEHTAFAALHLFDLPVAPYHYIAKSKPMDIYATPSFPMRLDKTAQEAFEGGTAIGAMIVGGVVVSLLIAGSLL